MKQEDNKDLTNAAKINLEGFVPREDAIHPTYKDPLFYNEDGSRKYRVLTIEEINEVSEYVNKQYGMNLPMVKHCYGGTSLKWWQRIIIAIKNWFYKLTHLINELD